MSIELLTRITGIVLYATFAMFGAIGADKTVSNKQFGFEITFPETWIEDLHLREHIVLQWASPKAVKAALIAVVNVIAIDMEKGETAKEFVDKCLKADESLQRELVSKTESKISEVNAMIVTFEISDETPVFKRVQYVLVSGKRGYLITAAAQKDDYDKYAKDIDAIVKSFKIIETK